MAESLQLRDGQGTGPPSRPWLLALVVAVVAMVVFAPAMSGEWIFDDRTLVSENPYIHSLAWWKRWFVTDFWDVNEELKKFGTRMIYWRPGVTASYAFDWKIGRGAPVMFHAANLMWHAVASVLAFSALRRWTGAVIPAFIAALLFAVHPTKAESVAWIAGRTDVLCLVFVLIAAEGAARRLQGRRGGIPLEIAGTVMSYLVKEHAVVLPAFIAVEAWVALGRPGLDRATIVRMIRAGAAQLTVAVVYLIVRSRLLPIRSASAHNMPLFDRAREVSETMGRYFVLLFYPHDLSVQQALLHTSGGHPIFDTRYVVFGALLVATLIGVALLARRKIPGLSIGIALFFVTILPTSNVVTMGMVTLISERFLYLPSLGIACAIGALLSSAGQVGTELRRKGTIAIATLAAFVLAIVAANRSFDFSDERRFWTHELELHPDSLEALRYWIAHAVDEKRFAVALELTARAQQTASKYFNHTGFEVDFLLDGIEVFLRKVPDHEEKTLRAVDEFCRVALEGNAASAQLVAGDIRADLPLRRGTIGRRIEIVKPRLWRMRAELNSRFGQDEPAVRFADTARSQCPGCIGVGKAMAIVEARAGLYERARHGLDLVAGRLSDAAVQDTRTVLDRAQTAAKQAEVATGPVQLMLRATELSNLEAWGRAYDVLAPNKDAIKRSPGFAIGFAELAWRAGESDVAREVLGANVPPERVSEMTQAWSLKMGWIDPPLR